LLASFVHSIDGGHGSSVGLGRRGLRSIKMVGCDGKFLVLWFIFGAAYENDPHRIVGRNGALALSVIMTNN
jgi:hypothetical protein